jgi:hypothetical protein
VFTFIPESCSGSSRNSVRNHLGIAFTFLRIPQPFHESRYCLLAVFVALLNAVFQTALNRHRDRLPPAARADVQSQRSKLAAIQTNDAATRSAMEEPFVEGYRLVLWMASGLAVLTSVSAAALLSKRLNRSSTSRTAISRPI